MLDELGFDTFLEITIIGYLLIQLHHSLLPTQLSLFVLCHLRLIFYLGYSASLVSILAFHSLIIISVFIDKNRNKLVWVGVSKVNKNEQRLLSFRDKSNPSDHSPNSNINDNI
jgi:hypothetical protein